jgi:hypothetical protein
LFNKRISFFNRGNSCKIFCRFISEKVIYYFKFIIEEFSENIGKDEDNKVKELKVNAPESGKSSQFVSSKSGKPSNENKESLQHEVKHEIVQQLKATPVEKIKEVQVLSQVYVSKTFCSIFV